MISTTWTFTRRGAISFLPKTLTVQFQAFRVLTVTTHFLLSLGSFSCRFGFWLNRWRWFLDLLRCGFYFLGKGINFLKYKGILHQISTVRLINELHQLHWLHIGLIMFERVKEHFVIGGDKMRLRGSVFQINVFLGSVWLWPLSLLEILVE